MSSASGLSLQRQQGAGLTLVTGATGFLGGRLVQRLLSDGTRVRVLVRSAARARPLAERGAELVVGDIEDEAAVLTALRGVQRVYHLAGKLLIPGVPDDEYRRTHVAGTRSLLAGIRREAGVRRLVHCSTTGVLGVTGDEPADEDAPLRPTNVYEATKAEAELCVREAMRSGLPAVIVRPGLVYGPGDMHLLGLFRTVLKRRFRPIGAKQVWFQPIYIDDMADALLRCGSSSAAIGECFHVAGPRSVSLGELAAAIAEAEGTSLPPGTIPLAAARALAVVGDLLPAPLRRAAPLTRSRLMFLTNSRSYDVTKARRVLGFVATTDLATGVERTVAWYREHGHLPAGAMAAVAA